MHALAARQLAGFLTHFEVEQRVSVHTLKSYQRDLRQLVVFCEAQKLDAWAQLQPSDIRQHIANRHRQGLSSKSLQRELSAMRCFYSYLLKNNLVTINPAQ